MKLSGYYGRDNCDKRNCKADRDVCIQSVCATGSEPPLIINTSPTANTRYTAHGLIRFITASVNSNVPRSLYFFAVPEALVRIFSKHKIFYYFM